MRMLSDILFIDMTLVVGDDIHNHAMCCRGSACTSKPSRLAKPTALSTMLFRSMAFLPRLTADAASTTFALQSRILAAMDSGEKPAKMTEWMAPIRAHASYSHHKPNIQHLCMANSCDGAHTLSGDGSKLVH